MSLFSQCRQLVSIDDCITVRIARATSICQRFVHLGGTPHCGFSVREWGNAIMHREVKYNKIVELLNARNGLAAEGNTML